MVAYAARWRLDRRRRQDSIFDVDVDWRVRFRIHNNDFTELDDTGYMFQNLLKGKPEDYGIDHEDVRSSADARRTRADDLMVLGSKWMIGQTIWVVTERSELRVDSRRRSVIVTLECKGAVGPSRIGIAGQRAVKEPWLVMRAVDREVCWSSLTSSATTALTPRSIAAQRSGTSAAMRLRRFG